MCTLTVISVASTKKYFQGIDIIQKFDNITAATYLESPRIITLRRCFFL